MPSSNSARVRRAFSVALCLALLAAVAPSESAGATGGECAPAGYPIEESRALGGAGWVSYAIQVNAVINTVGWEVLSDGRNSPAAATGMWLMNSEGHAIDKWTTVSSYGQPITVGVSTSIGRVAQVAGGDQGVTGGTVFAQLPVGRYRLVLAGYAKGPAQANAAICGENFTLMGSRSGSAGFIMDALDFGSTAAAYAGSPGVVGLGPVATAMTIQGAVTRRVGNRFFGEFATGPLSGTMQLTYSRTGQDTSTASRFSFIDDASGTYGFRATGMQAGRNAGLWCWGADVRLP